MSHTIRPKLVTEVEFVVVDASAADEQRKAMTRAAKLVEELGYAAALRLSRFNGWGDVVAAIRPMGAQQVH